MYDAFTDMFVTVLVLNNCIIFRISSDRMLRLSTIAARRLRARSEHLNGVRHASSLGKGGGGGAGKVVAGTVLLTAGFGGGVVGYASVDSEFRKLVQDTVPGSEDLLNLVLGSSSPQAVVTKPVPSKLKIPGPVVITKPKEQLNKVIESFSTYKNPEKMNL